MLILESEVRIKNHTKRDLRSELVETNHDGVKIVTVHLYEREKRMNFNWIGALFAGIVGTILIISVATLIAVILSAPLYFVWNWIAPQIFHLTKINIWQAVGINLLLFLLSVPFWRRK